MGLYYKILPSPIGEIRVYVRDRAVVGLMMGDHDKKGLSRRFHEARSGQNAVILQVERELSAFFSGRLKTFTVPVEVEGTDFQKDVWRTLQTISYGKLQSYGDVARTIGRPTAVRAVGVAIGSNPVPIIIPCHRVIGTDESLTGFGGGLAVKQRLLEIEGHTIVDAKVLNIRR